MSPQPSLVKRVGIAKTIGIVFGAWFNFVAVLGPLIDWVATLAGGEGKALVP